VRGAALAVPLAKALVALLALKLGLIRTSQTHETNRMNIQEEEEEEEEEIHTGTWRAAQFTLPLTLSLQAIREDEPTRNHRAATRWRGDGHLFHMCVHTTTAHRFFMHRTCHEYITCTRFAAMAAHRHGGRLVTGTTGIGTTANRHKEQSEPG
jgi:hypothetical protein